MQITMPRASQSGLAYVTANPGTQAFDRMDTILRRDRQEDRTDRLDAAMRQGASDFVRADKEREGRQQQQPGTTAAPTPVIEPAPMPAGGGGGVTVPPQYQAALDAATGGEGRIPGLGPLLASYTQHESNWDPGAVNQTSGATGLGQILASTAQAPGFGVQPISLDARRDPTASLAFMGPYMENRARAMGLTDLTDPAQMRTLLMGVSDRNNPAHIERIIASAGGTSLPAASPAAASPTALAPRGPNPLRALVAGLAQTPGGGQAAINALLQGERLGVSDHNAQLRAQVQQHRNQRAGAGGTNERFRAEQLAMTALGRGDMTTAQYWAQRAGIQLPASVAGGSPAERQRFSAGTMLARRFYQDRGQSMTFFQTYLRTGSVDQAVQAAGVPRENPRFQLRWIQDGEREVLAMIDPTGRNPTQVVQAPGQQPPAAAAPAAPGATAGPPQPSPLAGVQANPAGPQMSRAPWAIGGGEAAAASPPASPPATATPPAGPTPATRFRGQGSQARTPAMETRFQMLRRANVPEQEAAAIAAGATPTANSVAAAYRGVQRDVQQALDLPRDPAARTTEVNRRIDAAMSVFGPNWRAMLSGASRTPSQESPQVPAPVEPPPAPATSGGLPTIRTAEEYAALPPGSRYRDPNGNIRTKAAR